MTGTPRSRSRSFRGIARLAVDATAGVTDLVEALHATIAVGTPPLGTPPEGRTSGIAGLAYRSVRGASRLVGTGLDAALARLGPLLGETSPSPGREALLAAVNGVLGDYLEATGNPLAIPMRLRRSGRDLPLHACSLATAIPRPAGRLLLLVHGLCMSDLGWARGTHDHGAALERDLGWTSVYLRYNTGRHVSVNGRELSGLLEAFLPAWPVPVEDLAIVAHSMGGLVTRSALHYAGEAGHTWPRRLRAVVFLGTPHHGAPLERGGNLLQAALGFSPYSLPFARLGKVRSQGITDLRHGNLVDEDWSGRDRFARGHDRRRPLPLPEGVACHAVAATTAKEVGGLRDRLLGDGLVPVASALGDHADPVRRLSFPAERTLIVPGTHHFELLDRPEVTARLREWLADGGVPSPG